jgi:ribosomal-protein-alanine N-acetyltransferase
MRRHDLDDVCRIDRGCFPVPWVRSAYHTELNNRSASYFVARLEGKVVGYGGVWIIMDEAHITTIAVDPDYQGQKIGERILLELLQEGIAQGARRATLEVRENNRTAQNLYRKFGFREAALRAGYYTDNGENAIVMWADDMRSPEFRERLRALRRRNSEASR